MFLEMNDAFNDPDLGPFPLTGSVQVDCTDPDMPLCSGPDWWDTYPLDVVEDITPTFVLSWEGESDLDLYVLDYDCNRLAASNGTTENPERITASFKAGDTFSVQVSGWITNGAPQSYTVTLE
jgi:hypothetical protein